MAQAWQCRGAWRLILGLVCLGAVVFGFFGLNSHTASSHFGGAWEKGRAEKEKEG